MNKETFLHQLRIRLSQLPKEEIDKRLDYYSEIIDDMAEDGVSEEDAVASFGDMDTVARKIMEETPLKTLVQTKVTPKKGWSTAAIVITVLTCPMWIPLVLAFIAIIASVYIVIWSLILSLFCVVLSVGLCGLYLIVKAFLIASAGLPYMIFTIGCGILLIGLCLIFFLGAKAITAGLVHLTKWFFIQIKGLFIRKEAK